MAPSSRYFRPELEASSIPCSTAEGSKNHQVDAWCMAVFHSDRSGFYRATTLRHGLQLGGRAVGQSFPQVEDLDHRQDAEFLGQIGAAQLLGLMGRQRSATVSTCARASCARLIWFRRTEPSQRCPASLASFPMKLFAENGVSASQRPSSTDVRRRLCNRAAVCCTSCVFVMHSRTLNGLKS